MCFVFWILNSELLYFVFWIPNFRNLYFVNEHNSTLTSSYYPILVVRAGISILTAISAQKPDDDDVDGDFDDDVDDDDVDVDDDADDIIIKWYPNGWVGAQPWPCQ